MFAKIVRVERDSSCLPAGCGRGVGLEPLRTRVQVQGGCRTPNGVQHTGTRTYFALCVGTQRQQRKHATILIKGFICEKKRRTKLRNFTTMQNVCVSQRGQKKSTAKSQRDKRGYKSI
ncbi:uncharacterized protein LOC117781528 [Drosophila innubila]|uniref:uncharacterized protein LOC117781528 n=1 Tax=Drosophila innubila TaxID=198719 RepID=UPI00148B4B54|nr:uncharacterized protein LOC117781528 [Drosophila innubila]